MTSRTKERDGVKRQAHAILVALLLYQCTSVVGNPVAQWMNSLPAGSQYHPIVEHFINCYKTVSTQSSNDIGFMKCLALINSMLKTDSPGLEKSPMNSLFPVPTPPDLNIPKPVPARRSKIPVSQENNYVTATAPNSKILLYELKKLWDRVSDNPRLSANRQIVEKLNRMRATLQHNPTQQNILNLITDLRNHLKHTEVEIFEDEPGVFRNLPIKPTTAAIAEGTFRKITKPKPTSETVPSTEASNDDDELTFRANFAPEITSTIATETSPTNLAKVEKTEPPIFRSQFKTNKVPNEMTEKTTELLPTSESTNLNKFRSPAKLNAGATKIKQAAPVTITPPKIIPPQSENIEISPRLSLEKPTTENPEKFTKTVRQNFLQNNLIEKQAETIDSDDELSPRTGLGWPANDLIAHAVPHAMDELNSDIYLNPHLQNIMPSYTQFHPLYSSHSPLHYSPHPYMAPLRPEEDPGHFAGLPPSSHYYKCN